MFCVLLCMTVLLVCVVAYRNRSTVLGIKVRHLVAQRIMPQPVDPTTTTVVDEPTATNDVEQQQQQQQQPIDPVKHAASPRQSPVPQQQPMDADRHSVMSQSQSEKQQKQPVVGETKNSFADLNTEQKEQPSNTGRMYRMDSMTPSVQSEVSQKKLLA